MVDISIPNGGYRPTNITGGTALYLSDPKKSGVHGVPTRPLYESTEQIQPVAKGKVITHRIHVW